MADKITKSTVARIAGNIASGLAGECLSLRVGSIDDEHTNRIVKYSVEMARAIVAEVERTQPAATEAGDK